MELKINYTPGKHIGQLDGVRGLAILLVLIFHFFYPHVSVAGIGWIGVDLFFVLSGFLITGILFDTKTDSAYFKNFYFKRAVRIFPLYYATLLFFFFLAPLIIDTDVIAGFQYLKANEIYFWAYLSNILAVTDSDWPSLNALSHFWSLAIEEQFYMAWPLFIYLIPNKHLIKAIIGVIFLAIGFRIYSFVFIGDWLINYIFILARVDSLGIGALIAVMIRTKKSLIELYCHPFLLVSGFIICLMIVLGGSLSFGSPGNQTIGFTVNAVFFGCVLLSSLQDKSIVSGFFKSSLLRFLGKYSYGLYVYHKLVIYLLSPYLMNALWNQMELPDSLILVLNTTVLIFVTIIVAYISFHCMESRFLELKKFLVNRKAEPPNLSETIMDSK